MKTLGRNSDNDIFLGAHGDLSVITGKQAQSSVIESLILTQKGELQFDEDAGIDYFGTVLQNPRFIEVWAAQVQSAIEALPFVASVDDFEYKFDRSSSTLYWAMKVENTDGEIIEFVNKSLTLDGSPGIDIKWDNIYDKPSGTDEAIGVVANMQDAAEDVSKLNDNDTLRTVKNTINSLLFKSNDPEIESEREIVFSFSRIPVGLILNVANIKLKMEERIVNGVPSGQYYPCNVKCSDGTYMQAIKATGDDAKPGEVEIRFDENTEHVIRKNGDFSITLKGRIVGILTKDITLPVFLNSRGLPFPYLTKIRVGKTVPLSLIADSAFRGCDNLREVIWNESSVDSISFGSSAFEGCQSLIGLQWVPKKLASIGEYCFRGCTSLLSLKGLEESALTSIPTGCFYGCRALESAGYLPEAITEIPSDAFANCTALADIDSLPANVSVLASGCFMGCTGISSILYPPVSLKTIGENSFKGCTSLKSVYIGSGVKEIKDGAFSGCTNLDNIFVDAGTVPSIEGAPFADAALGFIAYVPKDKLEQYQSESGWRDIAILNFGEYEFQITAQNGLEIVGDKGNLSSSSIWVVDFLNGRVKTKRFTNDITKLPSHIYTSEEISGFPEVTISIKGYITEISGDRSSSSPFITTKLDGNEDVYPYLISFHSYDAPLELIGDYAFYNCKNLSYILLNKGDLTGEMPPYRIGDYAFYGCKSIHSLSWVRENISSHIIKTEDDGTESYYPPFGVGCFQNSGVRTLDYNSEGLARDINSFAAYCFSGSELESLDGIGGESFVSLGEYCFYKCESLEDISELIDTGVQFLPDYCFAGCKSLRSIHGIEYIISTRREWLDEDGDGNFTETRTTILGRHLFEGCIGLESIEPLADAFFIPPIDWDEHQPPYSAGIEDLSDYMFAGCTLIKSLEGIADRIRTLGEHCFDGCSGLSYEREEGDSEVVPMTYPLMPLASSKVTELPYGCFANCTGLQNLIGLSGITSIGDRCFENCTGLVSTSGIGFDIASLGAYVFSGCNNLSYVTCLAETPPTATAQTFYGIDLKSVPLYVREANVDRYSAAVGWNMFYNITHRTIKIGLDGISQITSAQAESAKVISKTHVGEDKFIPGLYFVEYGDGTRDAFIGDQSVTLAPHVYPTIGGQPQSGNYVLSLYGDVLEFGAPEQASPSGPDGHYQPSDGEGASPFLGTAASTISSLIVRSSYLEKIYPFSFCDCTSLTEADLEMSDIGEIGAFAFARCIWLPSVTAVNAVKLGDCAFLGCRLLGNVESFQTIKEVGYYCFYNDVVLTSIIGLSSAITIGGYAFAGCVQLTSTDGLSAAVKIGNNSFDGCSALATVSGFGGDISDIGDEAFKGCPVESVFIAASIPPFIRANTFDAAVYDSDSVEVFVPYSSIDTYKAQYPVVSGSDIWDGSQFNYWSRFKNIKARSLRLHLEGVVAGERFYGSEGEVVANGAWAISFGEGEQTLTFVGTSTLPTYTFNTAGDKDILISGAIRGIRMKSGSTKYPIFYTRETAYGTDKYSLTEIEGNRALELSSIGDNAFRNFTKLKSIKNLASVTTLGSNCFTDCKALTDVSGLNGVSYIGVSAFQGCSSLPSLKGLYSVSEISASAFSGCTSLKKIDGLGMNVSTIGSNAFDYCPLTEVQIFSVNPPIVSETAFSTIDKSNVPLYVLSRSLSDYSGWADFSKVSSRTIILTLKTVPANVIFDGGYGVVDSDTFWAVDFSYSNQNVQQIYGYYENGKMPTHTLNIEGADYSVRIDGGVTSISGEFVTDGGSIIEENCTPFFTTKVQVADGQFETRQYLTSVETNDSSSLETIGDWAFNGCTELSELSVKQVKYFGKYSFEGCTKLNELNGVVGAVDFGEGSFNSTGLTNLSGLGPDIEKIESKAFGNLDGISYIQIRATTAPELSEDAFIGSTDGDGNQIKIETQEDNGERYFSGAIKVYVPANSIPSYQNTEAWKFFRKWDGNAFVSQISSRSIVLTLTDVPTNMTFNPPTSSSGNVLSSGSWTVDWGDGHIDVMSENDTTLPQHTYTSTDTKTYTVTIDGDIERVQGFGDYSTTGFSNIRPMIFSSNNDYGYLTDVSCYGDMNLITIGASCFANCPNLTTVTGFTKVTTIGDAAFYGCQSLSSVGDFTSVKTIGKYAFAECARLSYVSCFPNAITVDSYAFFNDIALASLAGLGSVSGETAGDSTHPNAWFGDYSFAGTGLGVIDSEYKNPPTIQSTTFENTIATTVYVPVGSLQKYSIALWWRDYLPNIHEMCYMAFTFQKIVGTTGIDGTPTGTTISITDGSSFTVSDPNATWAIEWGDGSTDTFTGNIVANAQVVISHTYGKPLRNDIANVRFRGDFIKISASDSGEPIVTATQGSYLDSVNFYYLKAFTEIGQNTFSRCSGLRTVRITYPSDNVSGRQYLSVIGDNAFRGCTNLVTVDLDDLNQAQSGENICLLPKTITSLGTYAFAECSSLQKVRWTLKTDATGDYSPSNFVIPEDSFWFAGCISLTTVEQFGNIQTIPGHTFFKCTSLRGITDGGVLGNSLTTKIGKYAFAKCNNLGIVHLPSSIIEIGEGSFCCLSGLTDDYPRLPSISGLKAAINSSDDRGDWIPSTPVGMTEFSWDTAHGTNIVQNIWYGAFSGCNRMNVVGSFPENLIAYEPTGEVDTHYHGVPAFAFLCCSDIQDFTFLPNSGNVLTNNGIIGDYAFAYTGIMNLSNSVYSSGDKISDGMFMGCASLRSVYGLPNNITQFGDYSFAECINLSAITAPNVTRIGESCFEGCVSIQEIIPEMFPKVSIYPFKSFDGCYNITNITMPQEKITFVGESFAHCPSISSMDFPYLGSMMATEIVTRGGISYDDPFSGLISKNTVEITVPERLYDDYTTDNYWSQYEITTESIKENLSLRIKMTVPSGGGTLYGHGILYFKNSNTGYIDWGDGTHTNLIPETDNSVNLENINKEYAAEEYLSDTEITIAIYGEITSISGGIMDDGSVMRINPIFSSTTTYTEGSIESKSISYAPNSWITEITYFGHELSTINNGCFSSCSSLRIVTRLPDNLTTIGRYSFLNCVALQTLNFFKNSQLSSIGEGCFYDCSSLTDLTGLASCINLTEIPSNCFDSRIGISVLNVDGGNKLDCIPPNVILIGHYAFHNRQFSGFVSTNTKTISLGSGAFRGNKLLTDLSGLTFDLSSMFVFADCVGLESLTGLSIINSAIPRLTFYNCQKLKLDSTSTMPSQITRIGGGAFARCVSISSLEGLSRITILEDAYSGFGVFESTSISSFSSLPDSIQSIGSRAFAGCPITNMIGFNALTFCTTIGDYAFYGCGDQQDSTASFDLVLPPNLQSLGKYCFSNSKVKFFYPETSPKYSYMNSIGEGCFKDCLKITDISGLYNFIQLQELPKDCFKGCIDLEYFGSLADDYGGIPESVQIIKGGCFQGCQNIQYIVLRRYNPSDREYKVTTIEDTNNPAFDYSTLRSIARIEVPGGSKNDVDGYLSSSSGWIDGDTKFVDDMFTGYYILSFDPNGGNVDPSSIGIEEGTMIGIGTLPTPTRDGYSFIGWYTQQTDGDEVNSETVVTESMTIYAHWDPV